MEDTLKINYYGYFTSFGGYGIANLNWVCHLSRLGVDVYPHAKFIPLPGTPEYAVLTGEQRDILQKPFTRQRIGIIETTPFSFHLNKSKFKIANTMAESDEIGEPWVNACNSMDMVVVPNEFQKRVFEKSGVTVPVSVIRHGTWTEMFPYCERPQKSKFRFGIVGYLNDRKGVFELMKAFVSEFDNNEPVELYLKSSNKEFGFYRYFSDDRIITDTRHVSPEDLRDIYYSFDCFVFPSKAEGVGQPPREAMSTGLPTIVTNYSGLEEIADSEYAYPLEPISYSKGVNPHALEQPGNWANIDIQELMYWMRYVYEHQDEAREKGKRASKHINTHHTWEACAKDMIKLLKTI
ncbi:MAG: glycosyltransferase family 4 protein [Saprospiraceae bacterium]|nr:glycosyltransferase family 4 protein [Saprospiraceae bacterium]